MKIGREIKSQIHFLVNWFGNFRKKFEGNTKNTPSSIDDHGSERDKDQYNTYELHMLHYC